MVKRHTGKRRSRVIHSRGKCYKTVHHRATKTHRAYTGHKRVKCAKPKTHRVYRKSTRKAPRKSKCGCYMKAEKAEKRVLSKCLKGRK